MSEWKRVKLGDLLEEYCERNTNNEYTAVAIGKYGIRKREDIYTKELSKDISKNKIIMKNTLTIGMGSNQIDIGILTDDCKFCVSPAYTTYKIKKCNSKFLEYYMEYLNPKLSDLFMIVSARQGKSVDKEGLLKYEVMLPPIGEQEKIVEILKTIDSIIEKYKSLLEEKNKFIKSQFVEMFINSDESKKWNKIRLKDVCKMNPTKKEMTLDDGDLISFIPMANVSENGEIDVSNIRKVEEVKKGFTYFAENDVLFAKITPCMENGKGAVAKGLKNKVGFGTTEFHVIRPTEVINSIWIYTLFSLKEFRKKAESNMTGSTGQKRVPISFIENYKINLPPIELQNKFASFVEQIDKQEVELEKLITNYKALKKGLMQQLLTGKVRVKI